MNNYSKQFEALLESNNIIDEMVAEVQRNKTTVGNDGLEAFIWGVVLRGYRMNKEIFQTNYPMYSIEETIENLVRFVARRVA